MKRVLLLPLAILLFFGAAEGALRVYGFGRGIRYRPHPLLGWEMVPGQNAFNVRGRVPVRINRLGLRGPDAPMTKPPNALRLFCIGDGTTLNNQTAEEETFPFLARDSLQIRRPERHVEALVGAVSGYQLEQYLELLQLRESDLDPDIVVIGFCWNDWALDTRPEPGVGPRPYGEYAGEASWLQHSAIGDFWERLGRVLARRRQARAYSRGEHLPQQAQHEAVSQHVTSMLDSITGVCRRNGSQLALLLLPAQMTRHDPESFARRTRVLGEWALHRNVTFVDPWSRFQAAEARGVQPFLDELHLSANAQPLVAEALVDALVPLISKGTIVEMQE